MRHRAAVALVRVRTYLDCHACFLRQALSAARMVTSSTILELCSAEFREAFAGAPLIIAKGQANYETLSEAGPRVFCLLQFRGPVIAYDVHAHVGGTVVRQSRRRPGH